MLSALNIAASGLNTATARLNAAATNIARFGTGDAVSPQDAPSASPDAQPAEVDLARESVNLILDRHLYTANAKMLKSADQMLGTLLDVLAK